MLKVLSSNPPPGSPEHRIPVLSVSPQTLASLASTVRVASTSTSGDISPSINEVLEKVKAFALELGFAYVFDTTFARHLALQEHVREFEERTKAAMDSGSKQGSLPMLASACPGWVCYAEKAHAEMLPFISTTKSPQQVMGTLVKEWMGQKLGKRSAKVPVNEHIFTITSRPDQMYHVTVMPCYDKKLEASRQDFYNEQYRTRDVDCVITTGELDLLMKERNWDLSLQAGSRLGPDTFGIPSLLSHAGSSSGGWLQAILDDVLDRAKKERRDCSVRRKIIRTSDYEDVIVEAIGHDGQTEVIFRGAKCYGFRNLQNIVRKVVKESRTKGTGRTGRGRVTGAAAALRARRAKETAGDKSNFIASGEERPYDYVEVMACPSGCVNGGGQASRPSDIKLNGLPDVNRDTAGMGSRWGDREWVKLVEESYWGAVHDASQRDEADVLVTQIMDSLCHGEDNEEDRRLRRKHVFRTQYQAVVSDIIGLNVNW